MHKLGMNSSDTAEVVFENVVIPAKNLLGKEGMGFIDTMKVLDGGRVGIAALSVGIARGALEESLKYAMQRKQFKFTEDMGTPKNTMLNDSYAILNL